MILYHFENDEFRNRFNYDEKWKRFYPCEILHLRG